MGGTDDPSNLIELTVEEHAEAHRKLYEEHGHWQDKVAYEGLSGRIGKEEILRMKQGMANKGRKRTPEQRKRISEAAKKRVARQRADGTLERAAKKQSEALKGRKRTAEHIENWRKSREGWKHTEESKDKIKAKRAKQLNVRGVAQDVK